MLSKTDRNNLLLAVTEQFTLACSLKGECPDGSVILACGPAFFKAHAPHQHGIPSQMVAFDLYERWPASRPLIAFAYATVPNQGEVWIPPFIESHIPNADLEIVRPSSMPEEATIHIWSARNLT